MSSVPKPDFTPILSPDSIASADILVRTTNSTSPVKRRSQQRSRLSAAHRREQILEAASEAISTNGFWGFTIMEVAQLCGLSEPAVLYHFQNKETLLVNVLLRRDKLDTEHLAKSLGILPEDLWSDTVPFGLIELCQALVEHNAQQPEIVRLYSVMQAESLNEHHPAYSYFNDRETWALDLFRRAAIHSKFSNPAQTAHMFLSEMDGMQLRWLRAEHFDLIQEWNAFTQRFA